jgi:hypothetical protein
VTLEDKKYDLEASPTNEVTNEMLHVLEKKQRNNRVD